MNENGTSFINILNPRLLTTLVLTIVLVLSSPTANAKSYDELSPEFRQKWEALLHYGNERSSISADSLFFLSNIGSESPAAELFETINFFENNSDGRCRYPARYYLIYGQIPDETGCPDFSDYRKYVSVQEVSVVFASEDETSPVSSMGHLFLMVGGTNQLGLYKKHSFGFVADAGNSTSLLWSFLTDSIDGIHMLNPYHNTIHQYVSEEHRTLWEYSLDLTDDEKFLLYLHLFELKSHSMKYSFFTHNGAVGLERVLSVANKNLDMSHGKETVTTPVQYVKDINTLDLVNGVTIRPSPTDKYFIQNSLPLNPLDSPKTSRISLGYAYNSGSFNKRVTVNEHNNDRNGTNGNTADRHDKHYERNEIEVEFLPLYSDIYEDTSYTSKLNHTQFFKITGVLGNDYVAIRELQAVDIRSLPNIMIEEYKVNFGMAFHDNVQTTHTALYPDLYVGSGISLGSGLLVPFAESNIGVHIPHEGLNTYWLFRTGFFIKNQNLGRLAVSFDAVLSQKDDYRGYNSKVKASYSKSIFENIWISAEYEDFFNRRDKESQRFLVNLGYRF